MGLDTDYGCWRGAYSAFTRWRNKLAEVAGYPLVRDDHGYEYAGVVNDPRWTDANFQGEWSLPPEDPLLILLVHSDCDGTIPAKLVPFLRMRLEQLLPLLPDEDNGGHIGNWRDKTQAFIDGLAKAEADGEGVDFF